MSFTSPGATKFIQAVILAVLSKRYLMRVLTVSYLAMVGSSIQRLLLCVYPMAAPPSLSRDKACCDLASALHTNEPTMSSKSMYISGVQHLPPSTLAFAPTFELSRLITLTSHEQLLSLRRFALQVLMISLHSTVTSWV
jgi:hypothetical protein